MLTNTAIYRPFGKNRAQPKTRQKGEIFLIMHVVSYRIWLKCIVYRLRYHKTPFNALGFTLHLKVDLFGTRAIRPVIARSVQFSKIAEKNWRQIYANFFHWEIVKWKKGITVLVFAVELQKVRTKCITSYFWERTGTSFKVACMWNGEESIRKSPFTGFTSRYHS